MTFGIQRQADLPYGVVLEGLPETLKSEGFGVLTQIDMRDTLRDKLGIEFGRYKILGACNPPLAHRALQTDLDIGALLPCNIVVYEDGAQTVVTAVDPMATLAATSTELRPIASVAAVSGLAFSGFLSYRPTGARS